MIKPGYVILIDQSTSGTKALLFKKKIIDQARISHTQIYPQKGWVEHDPTEILSNVEQLVKLLIERNKIQRNDIIGIAITNQRETIVVWDKFTGEPIHNALVWQCKRSEKICETLTESGKQTLIKEKTGLLLDPYFSAPKLLWIYENNDDYKRAIMNDSLHIGTIDTWLIWNLTNKQSFVTEASNASRTMLFNIYENQWDDTLLEMFKVPHQALPEVLSSNANFGDYDGIPIISVLADSQSSLYANRCLNPGEAKATLGTGCSIMSQTGYKPNGSYKTLVETIAWQSGEKVSYAVEGVIRSLGDTLEWGKNELGLYDDIGETLSGLNNLDSHGVYLIPGQLGLGTPYWLSNVNAAILGLGRTSNKEDIIKSFFQSVIFQIKDVVDVIEKETSQKITVLRLDGGLSRNGFLMQHLANLLDISIQVSNTEELSAIGSLLISEIKDFKINYKEYHPIQDEALINFYDEWKALMPN